MHIAALEAICKVHILSFMRLASGGFVPCRESDSGPRVRSLCVTRNIPVDLFSVHICRPLMLHAIFQRCDLAREVRWRWRPISISLMDWKRFTRKSNKPGGRMCAHTLRHSGHFEITSPAVSNKQDNLCVVFSQTAARNEIAKWVRRLLQKLCDSAFWNVLFKAMKCL